jgi:hypothetical protein
MVKVAGVAKVNMGFYLTRWLSPLQSIICSMMANYFDNELQLRAAIAATAARMIAQDGADYESAKRKAARQILKQQHNCVLPDDAQIEQQVQLYNALFLANTQPARLLHLRMLALQLMQALDRFHPLLTGAVWHGSAGAHDDIELQLFADSAKEVELFLLDKNIRFELSETPHFKGRRYAAVETVSFIWHGEGVHAALYDHADLRGAQKPKADGSTMRTDRAGLLAMLASATDNTENTINANRNRF